MDRIWGVLLQHRRSLAALFVALAVLAGLSSLKQAPDTIDVTVARHDLRSGQILDAADLRIVKVTPSAAAQHRLASDEAVGRQIAGPMRAGEPVTDYRVLQPDSLAGYDADAVLTSIRVDRADGAMGVHAGDRVDVIAVDPDSNDRAKVVARGVEVVTVPTGDQSDVTALGVVTSEKNALALATAGLSARFSVIRSSS